MKLPIALLLLAVLALHQDFWQWTDKTLVFGFLPVGLAYHLCYSMLAAATMWVLVRTSWPAHLENDETVYAGETAEAHG